MSGVAPHHRPWQVDWKNPQWAACNNNNNNNSTSPATATADSAATATVTSRKASEEEEKKEDSEDDTCKQIVHVSAAQVMASELDDSLWTMIRHHQQQQQQKHDSGSGSSSNTTSTSTSDAPPESFFSRDDVDVMTSFLLTVTLLSPNNKKEESSNEEEEQHPSQTSTLTDQAPLDALNITTKTATTKSKTIMNDESTSTARIASEVVLELSCTSSSSSSSSFSAAAPSTTGNDKEGSTRSSSSAAPSSSSEGRILLSARLTWPETIGNNVAVAAAAAAGSSDATGDQKDDEETLNTNDRSSSSSSTTMWTELALAPWLAEFGRTTTTTTTQGGVVAATLCRRPASGQQRDDALELINSMGLGLPFGLDQKWNGTQPHTIPTAAAATTVPPVDDGNFRHESNPTNTATTTTTLRAITHPEDDDSQLLQLACITSHGLICIYSPWDLFRASSPSSRGGSDGGGGDISSSATTTTTTMINNNAPGGAPPPPPLDDTSLMAQWFLGGELFQKLESTWLPLSEPITTISLSVLDPRWNRQQQDFLPRRRRQRQRRRDANKDAATAVTADVATIRTPPLAADATTKLTRPPPPQKGGLFSWNPWIESSTLPHCTAYNRANSIQIVQTNPSSSSSSSNKKKKNSPPTGHSYLVVLGQGIPRDSDWWTTTTTTTTQFPKAKSSTDNKTKEVAEFNDDDDDDDNGGGLASTTTKSKEYYWWQRAGSKMHPLPKIGSNLAGLGGPTTKEKEWWDLSPVVGLPPKMSDDGDEQVDRKVTAAAAAATRIDVGKQNKPQPIKKKAPFNDCKIAKKMGGFVSFCSVASWSETKTLFLNFVPRSIAHIGAWHGMELLMCLGDDRAVAIRLDTTGTPIVVGTTTMMDDDDVNAGTTHLQSANLQSPRSIDSEDMERRGRDRPTVSISRFQVMPIDLPGGGANNNTSMMAGTLHRRILCGAGTTPPGLLELYSEQRLDTNREHAMLVMPTLAGVTNRGSITTVQSDTRVAQIPTILSEDEEGSSSLLKTCWGYLGQGWSLVGTSRRVYFVCWEGANAVAMNSNGNFLQELADSPSLNTGCTIASVLPLPSGASVIQLPASGQEAYSSNFDTAPTIDGEQALGNICVAMESIIVKATEGIDNKEGEAPLFRPLSHQERSKQLIRQLSSWTQLENSLTNRMSLERQQPVLTMKTTIDEPQYTLSLRRVVIENGKASPFSQVLGWLSQREDYFTAASIALDLLRDPETLFHLWKNADKIDEEDEQSKLKGLLDGIIPIGSWIELDESPAIALFASTTLTQLADMTVGCLVKGGLSMSSTLIKFLQSNAYYDSSRASLILAATCTSAISGDQEAHASVMGQSRETASNGGLLTSSIFDLSDLLWPVRCLIEIGTARNHLSTVLNLLNATIPDELRCRTHHRTPQVDNKSHADLELTKALVRLIVASSGDGADTLLELQDNRSSSKYWLSMDSETQRTLSLIDVGHKHPLLHHQQVREWVRAELHAAVQGGSQAEKKISKEWLQDLVMACLFNAGCDLQDFVLDPTNMSMISIGSENSALLVDFQMDGEDGLFQHRLEIIETRNALEPAPGIGGLDLDLLIAALLLLGGRQTAWRRGDSEHLSVSTQALLDAACYFAGRPTSQEPRFPLDARTLMQLCSLCGNVRAGANLIGGRDGFVLSCCDVLMVELQVSMERAEAFLLGSKLEIDQLFGGDADTYNSQDFFLTESHRQLLWLLDEHVLSIRTYGEFEAMALARGRVDPIFCARSILRSWLCLAHTCKAAASTWLVRWLRARLGLDCDDLNSTGHHRLACAALVRALLWSSSEGISGGGSSGEDRQPLLAQALELEQPFLVQLVASSCGLVESIPPHIANGIIGLAVF